METWDDLVKDLSWGWGRAATPEQIVKEYYSAERRLAEVREILKNPIHKRGGQYKDKPLAAGTVKCLESEERKLIRELATGKELLKRLAQYNLLPTSKLISGEARMQFVCSLRTMIFAPELGKAIYYLNKLLSDQLRGWYSATNEDEEEKQKDRTYHRYTPDEERSRECLVDNIIESLSEALLRIKGRREKLIYLGKCRGPRPKVGGISAPGQTIAAGGEAKENAGLLLMAWANGDTATPAQCRKLIEELKAMLRQPGFSDSAVQYRGWTVIGIVEDTLKKLTGTPSAGRTEAGEKVSQGRQKPVAKKRLPIVHGGLYVAPKPKPNDTFDILSSTYKAWQRKQAETPENHKNS